MVRSPLPDDRAFVELLADRELYCIPGSLQGAQEYFRVSLTASAEMIKRALPLFDVCSARGKVGADKGEM